MTIILAHGETKNFNLPCVFSDPPYKEDLAHYRALSSGARNFSRTCRLGRENIFRKKSFEFVPQS